MRRNRADLGFSVDQAAAVRLQDAVDRPGERDRYERLLRELPDYLNPFSSSAITGTARSSPKPWRER
jgi:hypothetical protein